jgi:hypothetical protein
MVEDVCFFETLPHFENITQQINSEIIYLYRHESLKYYIINCTTDNTLQEPFVMFLLLWFKYLYNYLLYEINVLLKLITSRITHCKMLENIFILLEC